MRKLWLMMLILAAHTVSFAQQPARQSEPKTKMEDFIAQDGVVIVRGYTSVGELKGLYGTSIVVESKEFTNAGTKKKQFGITIEVKETSRLERSNTSYIDYDEITSLLQGLDYIGGIDKSVTDLDDFQADYRTKGDFEVSTFSSGSKTMVAVESGSIGSTTAYYAIDKLKEIAGLIKQAKALLDPLQ